jgi:RNA polymerase sigma-70 factor (ECF subfamily)
MVFSQALQEIWISQPEMLYLVNAVNDSKTKTTLPAHCDQDDLALIILVSDDDHAAFSMLYKRHWQMVYAVAREMTRSGELAEVVVQDVFIKVWTNRKRLPDVKCFRDYLFIIARNHILNALRKKLTEESFLSRQEADPLSRLGLPEEYVQSRELTSILQHAVARLPRQQQMVYQLADQGDLDQASIGQIMGISKFTVKNHMQKAVQSIRSHILRITRE